MIRVLPEIKLCQISSKLEWIISNIQFFCCWIFFYYSRQAFCLRVDVIIKDTLNFFRFILIRFLYQFISIYRLEIRLRSWYQFMLISWEHHWISRWPKNIRQLSGTVDTYWDSSNSHNFDKNFTSNSKWKMTAV